MSWLKKYVVAYGLKRNLFTLYLTIYTVSSIIETHRITTSGGRAVTLLVATGCSPLVLVGTLTDDSSSARFTTITKKYLSFVLIISVLPSMSA